MRDNLWLLVRNVVAILLFPGVVAGYIPYLLLEPFDIASPVAWSSYQYAAAVLLATGVSILAGSVWSFARIGRGTLAPFDETNRLIVVGLYRYVRNPMYVGVMMILLAESWFFWSSTLFIYSCVCFAVANILVIGYEENRLRYKYGDEFRRYCEHVGRWTPGRPYDRAG